ncbi:MAG: DUF2867 domain-containing protein [Actinobacteria bacterium]|uniref:Unannotated protein n=2 Tax=freshwater metagenome TaxID=449393 RepID=A0A6J6A5I6_9ZZZZ|nr:DUF2867 domain-containing protein [Actinomycetota bacterium]MSX91809.1 DUF2867 domain-containing protein [Actinomycetota bacterium]MSZ82121.1 DUF2867 domain-containing protein [Actinomycetota bacterium]MTB16960.1 DUF2867 domain-containing protein [Actinomycetota bacterium]
MTKANKAESPGVLPGALVLVTGASGYVGGRLVTVLLERGYRVRCLVRTPAKVLSAPWRTSVEIVQGDVGGDLSEAMTGVDAAFYLVHSIGSSAEWAEHDRAVAENFRRAAESAALQRIVYLGGLGDHSSGNLSEHLASRQEVGAELAKGSVPVVELRAAVVIGSGSASFEMLRYLVEVLPAMVTPRWVDTKCQPVAVRDVLHFLVESLTAEVTGQVLDVGGPEVLTYRQMMAQYAEVAGLRRRLVVPVPFLTPGLSSRWIGLVTPIPPMLARPLIQSLVNDVIVTGAAAADAMPIEQLGYREAVKLALGRSISGDVPTSWAHAELGGRPPAEPQPTDPAWSGGTVNLDRRERHVAASPAELFQVVSSIGGRHGWYTGDWLWSLRGIFDSLIGGVGMRRGRIHSRRLSVGDPLDFWRVEALVPGSLLRLRAEMRLPGDAWLQWQMEADDTGATITQTARFHPRGLLGRLYWVAVAPFHRWIFPGLLAGICADGERLHSFVHTPDRDMFERPTDLQPSAPAREQGSYA